jgi:hypothetical protein
MHWCQDETAMVVSFFAIFPVAWRYMRMRLARAFCRILGHSVSECDRHWICTRCGQCSHTDASTL